MQKKQVKVPVTAKEEHKKMYYHFGYTLKDEIDAGSETILHLERDENYPLMDKVIKLEKEYLKTTKKFPVDGTVTTSLAVILLIVGAILQSISPIAAIILISLGGILLLFGAYLLVVFFTFKTNKAKIQKTIFKKCDEFLFQNMPDLPLGDNVAARNEATDDIKINVKIKNNLRK